jgi:hypothetical protein
MKASDVLKKKTDEKEDKKSGKSSKLIDWIAKRRDKK